MSTAKTAARGAAWTITSSVLARGLGLIGTLVLTRFVVPAEYGEVSAATVVVATINQLSTIGVGVYAIANPDATREDMFHATFIHVALGMLALVVTLALGRPLSPLFDTPTMYRYIPGLAAAAFIDRVAFMPERVLIRNLRFPRVSLARSAGELTYTAFTIATAYRGWGGTAIVAGTLARSLVRGVAMTGSVPLGDWLRVVRLRLAVMRKLTSYGFAVTVGGLAYFASRRWDNLLVARFFGPAVMATYNLAYNLADIPAIQIGEQITDVMQASFAHMDVAERRRTLLRSLAVLALVTFPVAVGLGAIAPTLAALLLDKKWGGAGEMLVVLSMLSLTRPVFGLISSYLLVELGPRVVVAIEWLTLGLLMAGIATVGRISPLATCGVVGAVFTFRSLAGMWLARRRSGISFASFVGALLPPLFACVALAVAVSGARVALVHAGVRAPIVRLGVEVIVGALVYAGVALVIAREPAHTVLKLLRERRSRPTPPPAAPGAAP